MRMHIAGRGEIYVRQLRHDPFGRFTVISIEDGTGSCMFCGRRGKVRLYGTLSDGYGARPGFGSGQFCSKSCRNSFHGSHL